MYPCNALKLLDEGLKRDISMLGGSEKDLDLVVQKLLEIETKHLDVVKSMRCPVNTIDKSLQKVTTCCR
jgi:hypothetical protein